MNITIVGEQVAAARDYLTEVAGWKQISEVGDLASPDGDVWFSSGYTYGEYTLTTSQRPNGAGPAKQEIRVRLNEALIADGNGELGIRLARDLDEAAKGARNPDSTLASWPPPLWSEKVRG